MLKVENVSKVFRQGANLLPAVRNVNIRLKEGERVYIHGPSGAGKSTLLHMMCGLNAPTDGVINFKGKSVYGMSDRQRSRLRNRNFGFVFQFYHLLPELNVLENVMLPAMIKGGESGRRIRSRASELLEMVGMEKRTRHRPSQISGGEAQRTAIARALVNSPGALFCDEPTGNLDSEMSAEIYRLILNISDRKGMSVIVVSHEKIDVNFYHTEYAMKDGVLGKVAPKVRSAYADRIAALLETGN